MAGSTSCATKTSPTRCRLPATRSCASARVRSTTWISGSAAGSRRSAFPLPHIPGSDVAGEVVSAPGGLPLPGTRVMLQPGLSCGSCGACLAGADNLCARYDVLGIQEQRRLRGARHGARRQPPADSRHARLRGGCGLSSHVPDGLAHARGSRASAGRRVGAGACRGQRRGPGGDPDGAAARRARDCHRRNALPSGSTRRTSAPTRCSITTRRRWSIEVRARHRPGAAWTSSSSTWAKPPGNGASAPSRAAAGSSPAAPRPGPNGQLDLRALFARQISLLGSYMGSKGELVRAASLLFAGRLAPVIDSVFPLARAAEAQARLESGQQFGKIVLEI